jgi:hypothetical protein
MDFKQVEDKKKLAAAIAETEKELEQMKATYKKLYLLRDFKEIVKETLGGYGLSAEDYKKFFSIEKDAFDPNWSKVEVFHMDYEGYLPDDCDKSIFTPFKSDHEEFILARSENSVKCFVPFSYDFKTLRVWRGSKNKLVRYTKGRFESLTTWQKYLILPTSVYLSPLEDINRGTHYGPTERAEWKYGFITELEEVERRTKSVVVTSAGECYNKSFHLKPCRTYTVLNAKTGKTVLKKTFFLV